MEPKIQSWLAMFSVDFDKLGGARVKPEFGDQIKTFVSKLRVLR